MPRRSHAVLASAEATLSRAEMKGARHSDVAGPVSAMCRVCAMTARRAEESGGTRWNATEPTFPGILLHFWPRPRFVAGSRSERGGFRIPAPEPLQGALEGR